MRMAEENRKKMRGVVAQKRKGININIYVLHKHRSPMHSLHQKFYIPEYDKGLIDKDEAGAPI